MAARDQGSERVALVTGGTRGIGFGIASCLARDGYSLVLGFNSNSEAAEKAQRQLKEQHGVEVELVGGDVALPATWDAYFDRVGERFGNRLTAFVHNAGLYIGLTSISEAQPKETGPEHWEDTFQYYYSVYTMGFRRGLTRAMACEGLKHVLAISGHGCNATMAVKPVYEGPGQAKAAMEYLVRSYARKLAPDGVNVNAIVPGYIRTEAWSALGAPEEKLQEYIMATPAQRWGSPRDIGECAAFLCSERGAFVTGTAIPVDGGLHLRG